MTKDNDFKDGILKDFIPQLKSFVQSETVFGKPYEVGDITIIPVNSVKVGFGFSSGGISKSMEGGAGGGGVLLTPLAFLIIKGDTVTTHSLTSGTIEAILEKVPDFLEKLVNLVKSNVGKGKKSEMSSK